MKGAEGSSRFAGEVPRSADLCAILECTPDAMLIVDSSGHILMANSQAHQLFGYAPEELIGLFVEILLPDRLRDLHVRHRHDYAASPRTRAMGTGLELSGRRKDGSTFPVEISLRPLGGEQSGLVASAIRDVTDQRKLEQELRVNEERFRLLVQEVRDYAIFMLDPNGIVLSWSVGAEKTKGYRADEIIGQHFSRFYPAEEAESGKPDEELKIAVMDGRFEEEGWRIRKDGSRFWASVVITAIRDGHGKLLGFTKVTRDITESKRVREAFLLEMTNALVSNLDVRQLLSAIALCLRQVKPIDYASLALHDAKTGMLRIQPLNSNDGGNAAPEESLVPLANTPAGWAFTARKPLILHGRTNEKWAFEMPPFMRQQSLKSGCWLPLVGREGVLGTLNIFSREAGAYTDDDVVMFTQIAGQVAIALENALAFRRIVELNERLAEEKQYLEDELRTEFNFEEIVGQSPAWRRVLKQIETVAKTDSTVLLLGETGTGKELLARAIHDLSPRGNATFVRVNCASIPSGLLESELFGHEKGAFTGAIAQRLGRFEIANHGTLLLDEVGEIPLELQPKLLRVLQERQFERLGNQKTISTDVRIVASTNRDLAKEVAAGQFRSDLFYRLNVFPVQVPPLRERREDIPLLTKYFLAKYAARMKRAIETIPPDRMEALCRYAWPGNVRELEHLIERAVILSNGPVLNVPPFEAIVTEQNAQIPSSSMEEAERKHILRVLHESKGKIAGPGGAAEKLGMNRTTLNSRMAKLGISRKDI